jgi:integrase
MRADGTRPYDAYVQRAVVDAAVEETCRKLGAHPLPHSFPFLLSGSTGQVIEPVLSFLAAKFVVRQMPGTASRMRNSPHTRTATAADLNHFLDYLDASGLSLNDTTDDVIEGYAGSMLGRKSRATGNEYAHETVSRRMSTLRAFLSWMQNESRLPHRLRVLGTTEREYSGSVGHGLKAGRLDGERERDGTINVLIPEEARAIFQALGPLPSQAMRGESSRDRLAAQLALDTGLRRSEVTSVMVKDVTLALSNASAAKPYAMQVLRVFGKGRRWRKILVPVWLLQELSAYIHNERRESVEAGQELLGPGFTDSGHLFVNGARAATRRGLACAGDTIYQAFHKAQKVLFADGSLKQLFRFHDLRHTYATWTWVARKRSGDPQPSKFVQSQLGHAHVQTTEAIYLHTVTLFEATLYDDVAKALDLRADPRA